MAKGPVNHAFLAKAINRAQRLSIEAPFCQALHEFITAATPVAWDDDRALFWVEHPNDGWQVEAWMMPVASKFEPMGAA